MPIRSKNDMPRPYSDKDVLDSKLLDRGQKRLLLSGSVAATSDRGELSSLRELVADSREWQAFLSPESHVGNPLPTPDSLLLRRAKTAPPFERAGTVTAFSRWVHGLYASSTAPSSMSAGIALERQLATSLLKPAQHDRWKLIYNGMGDRTFPALEIPSLSVAGQSLVGSPDLVFREIRTGRILIVEIKTTNLRIPTGGWPDVRAQLWAYAHIPEFSQAPEVLLRASFYQQPPMLHRRCVVGWSFQRETFDNLSSELFSLYKRHHEGKHGWDTTTTKRGDKK